MMSIEEIKEVKEEYEDEKENELNYTQKKFSNSNDLNENSKENDNIIYNNSILNRKSLNKSQKSNDLIVCNQSISFNITASKQKNNTQNKSQIFVILLLTKQIKFNVKPYIFNLLKKYWIENLKK